MKAKNALRIVKRARFFIIVFLLFAIIHFVFRFRILRVPDGYICFSSGSYILIDFGFSKGRNLTKGDFVLFQKRGNRKQTIGKILSVIDTAKGKQFLLQIQTKKRYLTLEVRNNIKGRILMVLLESENGSKKVLPKINKKK